MGVSESNRASPGALLSIVPMRDGDAERANRLFAQVLNGLPFYNEMAKHSEREKYTASRLREAVRANPEAVLLAEINGEAVGYCFSSNDDGVTWLSWFGVHPSFQRRGVGAAMLRVLEERMLARGHYKIWCDCRTTNIASKVTLAACGYEPLCTVRNHWYGQDFILWEKLLVSHAA